MMLLLSGKTKLTKSNKTLETEENSKGQLSLMSIRKHLSMLGKDLQHSSFQTASPLHGSPVFILNGCGYLYFLFSLESFSYWTPYVIHHQCDPHPRLDILFNNATT